LWEKRTNYINIITKNKSLITNYTNNLVHNTLKKEKEKNKKHTKGKKNKKHT